MPIEAQCWGGIAALLAILFGVAACTPQHTALCDQPDVDDKAVFCAWDFSLEGVDGETYTLSELRGDWVIINFWATWCVPCVQEMPELQAIAEEYADRLTILGINQREASEVVEAFAADLGITFPLLLNPDDQTLVNYQVLSLPQTIIVNPEGEVVWRAFGPIDLDSFGATFDELLIEAANA